MDRSQPDDTPLVKRRRTGRTEIDVPDCTVWLNGMESLDDHLKLFSSATHIERRNTIEECLNAAECTPGSDAQKVALYTMLYKCGEDVPRGSCWICRRLKNWCLDTFKPDHSCWGCALWSVLRLSTTIRLSYCTAQRSSIPPAPGMLLCDECYVTLSHSFADVRQMIKFLSHYVSKSIARSYTGRVSELGMKVQIASDQYNIIYGPESFFGDYYGELDSVQKQAAIRMIRSVQEEFLWRLAKPLLEERVRLAKN